MRLSRRDSRSGRSRRTSGGRSSMPRTRPSATTGGTARPPTGRSATFAKSQLDTDLWVVAWDGDQVAGVVQNWIWPEENETLGVKRGWLEHVSVRRPWRRRGLGRAITKLSLERFREAGMTDAMLGMDTQN